MFKLNSKIFIRKYLVPLSSKFLKYRLPYGIQEGYIIVNKESTFNKNNFFKKLEYYVPMLTVQIIYVTNKIPLKYYFMKNPILTYGFKYKLSERFFLNIFNLDEINNPTEAWAWHRLINYLNPKQDDILLSSKQRFKKELKSIMHEKYEKSYIFGTGPSLINADKYDWSDGYRIVCNTIVKSDKLWKNINPHFIVAGDAIHHFSHTNYAKAFRKDLAYRLENSKVLFIYPELFHKFIINEFSNYKSQLFPIPSSHYETILINLTLNFVKPSTENILSMLQFPLAYTLSKKIFFYGYDGRGKNDKMFWESSKEYNYIEYMPELHTEFPGFFDYYINNQKDKNSYVNKVHGDYLDNEFIKAENEGYSLVMLHKSHTETFQKRYKTKALKIK